MPTEEEKNRWIKFLEKKKKEHPYFSCKNVLTVLKKNPCDKQCVYCNHLYKTESGKFKAMKDFNRY